MPDHAPRSSLPIVAIVGRPNVGKSTLFNRYTGARRALVEDVPGVTRDRIAEEVEVEGHRLLLVDTAGLDPEPGTDLAEAVQAQARIAAADADGVLFVVDGRAGLLPEDEAIARSLRRGTAAARLVVNKLDLPQHDALASEFHALGLPLDAVSAEHGRGAFDALEALVEALPVAAEPETAADDALRIAIVGRPNVGKSSLLNRLLGSERVVVSAEPGTTRDAVDVRLDTDAGPVILVDTAGMRRPGRRTQIVERGSALMAVRSLERADVALALFDAGEGIRDQDVRVAALARERGCAVLLLGNKADLLQESDAARSVRDEVERRMRFMADAPLLLISAQRGTRVGRILPAARELAATASRRLATHELNEWLQDAVRRHEPSMAQKGSRRRPIKFFYAAQTGVRPPTFVLFCTDPRAVQASYRRYLEKRLREHFRLEGTPLRLRLRARGGSA